MNDNLLELLLMQLPGLLKELPAPKVVVETVPHGEVQRLEEMIQKQEERIKLLEGQIAGCRRMIFETMEALGATKKR